jgi:hypothetical protein
MKLSPGKGTTAKHAGSVKHAAKKKHTPTKAQQNAAKKWAKAGGKAAHTAAVKRHAHHAKPAPATWSPGLDVACCAAEALAETLRLTGRVVTGTDVLDLYWHTTGDPGKGATLEATFEAAATYGLAGIRLTDAHPAAIPRRGAVCEVDLAERHAVVLDGCGVWSWGDWWPLTRPLQAAAAWDVTWREAVAA